MWRGARPRQAASKGGNLPLLASGKGVVHTARPARIDRPPCQVRPGTAQAPQNVTAVGAASASVSCHGRPPWDLRHPPSIPDTLCRQDDGTGQWTTIARYALRPGGAGQTAGGGKGRAHRRRRRRDATYAPGSASCQCKLRVLPGEGGLT